MYDHYQASTWYGKLPLLSIAGALISVLHQLLRWMPEPAVLAGPLVMHAVVGLLGFARAWKERRVSGASIGQWLKQALLILALIVLAHLLVTIARSLPESIQAWLFDGILFALVTKLFLDGLDHIGALGFHLPLKGLRARLAQYAADGSLPNPTAQPNPQQP